MGHGAIFSGHRTALAGHSTWNPGLQERETGGTQPCSFRISLAGDSAAATPAAEKGGLSNMVAFVPGHEAYGAGKHPVKAWDFFWPRPGEGFWRRGFQRGWKSGFDFLPGGGQFVQGGIIRGVGGV